MFFFSICHHKLPTKNENLGRELVSTCSQVTISKSEHCKWSPIIGENHWKNFSKLKFRGVCFSVNRVSVISHFGSKLCCTIVLSAMVLLVNLQCVICQNSILVCIFSSVILTHVPWFFAAGIVHHRIGHVIIDRLKELPHLWLGQI